MLGVNASIDDQANRAEKFVTEASKVSEWIVVVPSDLFRQPFAVEGPALHVRRKRDYLAKLRNALELLRSGDLPMVTGDALMIRECWHAPFGHLVHVPQVREKDSRTTAIHGRNVVIRSRSGCFLKLRDAAHFDLGTWSCEK